MGLRPFSTFKHYLLTLLQLPLIEVGNAVRADVLSTTLLEEKFGDIVGKHRRELHMLPSEYSPNESEMRATEASLDQLLFLASVYFEDLGIILAEGNPEELRRVDGKAIPLQSYECY